MKRTICVFAATLALALAGCSDDDQQPDGGGQRDSALPDTVQDPDSQQKDSGNAVDKEACAHLTKGPFVVVAAGADAKSAPAVKADHRAYRVALKANAAGFVSFAAADKGDRAFYLDRDIKLEFQDDKGKAVTVKQSVTSVQACTEVKAKHTVDLPAAGAYYLELGPETADAKVTMIIEAGH